MILFKFVNWNFEIKLMSAEKCSINKQTPKKSSVIAVRCIEVFF
jgi:hypothetical protein